MSGGGTSGFDAVVMGGGPAGAAVPRLLARWGHRVCVLTRRASDHQPLAVSIPTSSRKLMAVLGVTDVVEAAGFQRSR